jgi:hypothetical protein
LVISASSITPSWFASNATNSGPGGGGGRRNRGPSGPPGPWFGGGPCSLGVVEFCAVSIQPDTPSAISPDNTFVTVFIFIRQFILSYLKKGLRPRPDHRRSTLHFKLFGLVVTILADD